MDAAGDLDAAIARVAGLSARDETRAALAAAADAESLLETIGADRSDRVRLAAFRTLPRFMAADYDAAALAAETALLASEGAGPEARALALAARLLSGAGALWAAADRDAEERCAEELWSVRSHVLGRGTSSPATLPGIALLIESLFVTGRVALAAQALDEAFPGHDWAADPLPREAHGEPLPSLPFLPLRVLVFAGRVAEAESLFHRVLAQARASGDHVWVALSPSIRALLAAGRGDLGELRSACAAVAAAFPRPRGHLPSAARALAGAALAATGDLEGAASEIRAGGGPGLGRLILVERALGIEVLVSAALARGDRPAAERWARRLLPLSVQHASEPVSERVFALLDLERGAAESARQRADVALARAAVQGVHREAVRSELVLARALAESGRTDEAASRLQRVAAEAGRRGDARDRRHAARQLRAIGRRVLPEAGSGWDGLTEREREIALLAARGYDNRAIGAALFLSPRTVQGSLTRVMSAFGVARRSALASRIGAQPTQIAAPPMRPAPLTARQAEIARRVAAGLTNAEIARELGISAKTVEHHLSNIFLAWEVRSRTAVAHLASIDAV